MATHSSILAWRISWTGEPGGLQSMGRKESDKTECLSLSPLRMMKAFIDVLISLKDSFIHSFFTQQMCTEGLLTQILILAPGICP